MRRLWLIALCACAAGFVGVRGFAGKSSNRAGVSHVAALAVQNGTAGPSESEVRFIHSQSAHWRTQLLKR